MPMTTRGRRRDYRQLAGLRPTKTMKITRKVRVKSLAPTTQAAVTQVVKRQIARNQENKTIGNNVELDVTHNSSISAADCQPLVPTISLGTQSYNRIGDRIKPKSLVVKGVVSLTPDSAIQKDIYVRILILAQKNVKTGAEVLAGAIDATHLLKPNSPAIPNQSYTGDTPRINYPLNTDLFRVYMDKTIKLTFSASTGVESMHRQSQRWSYRFKSLPANLTFDDGNLDWPNNFAPFLAVGYAFSDGTAPDIVTRRVISNCFSTLTWEDA